MTLVASSRNSSLGAPSGATRILIRGLPCGLLQFRFTCPEIANRFGEITDLREYRCALLAGGRLGSEAHMELAIEREPEIADVGPLLSIDGIVEAEHILRTGKAQEHFFAGHVGVHAIVGVDVRDVRTDGECSIMALLEEQFHPMVRIRIADQKASVVFLLEIHIHCRSEDKGFLRGKEQHWGGGRVNAAIYIFIEICLR